MRRIRWIGAMLIITSLIIMLLPVSEADAAASASDFVIQGVTLTKYKGTEKNVVVPSTVEIIGGDAFQENTNIEKLTLPNSVKTIEAYSFWGCDRLATVVFGNGITEVGDMAFLNCTGLKYITIPRSVRSIGIQAFAYCESLEDITIPPQVTDIREDSFDGDYLLNIHCEAGSYADKYAKDFYERQKQMPVYQEPESEGDGTPGGDPNSGGSQEGGSGEQADPDPGPQGELLGTTHVVGNQAVVFMQGAAQNVVDGGTEGNTGSGVITVLPVKIAERAFYRNDTLREAEVGESILEIGSFAYARSALSQLTLHQGLEKIDYAAFYYCRSLDSVELPDTVTEVAPKAFAHTPWVENFLNGAVGSEDESPFLISGGVLVAYRGSAEEVVVPDGVRVIAGEAFADHVELKKVTLPDSVQAIGDKAFENCGLETLEYEGDALSEDVLEECIRIEEMGAPPMKESGFRWTWGLAVVMLPAGVLCVFGRKRTG